jgi:hypothetical protein
MVIVVLLEVDGALAVVVVVGVLAAVVVEVVLDDPPQPEVISAAAARVSATRYRCNIRSFLRVWFKSCNVSENSTERDLRLSSLLTAS